MALVRSDPNLLKVYPDDEGQKPDSVFCQQIMEGVRPEMEAKLDVGRCIQCY